MTMHEPIIGTEAKGEYNEAPVMAATATATATATAAVPMVNVIAPSTLPEGYTFEAQIGDQKFMAVVPQGGVKEGETFLTPMTADRQGDGVNVPIGHWKDGLFDCCSLGLFHPSFCCSMWCTQCAMGQVMQRMRLTWIGHEGSEEKTKNTFKVVVVLVIAYQLFDMCMDYLSPDYVNGEAATINPAVQAVKTIVAIVFSVWAVYALMKTRNYVRRTYQIEEERCHGCEDLCCALWCSCCTTSQLLRHTGEYEKYSGSCCTETGLPKNTPAIV